MHPEPELSPQPTHVPATPETSTTSENVEMIDDDGGDTPHKSTRAAKRVAVASTSDVPDKHRQRIEDPVRFRNTSHASYSYATAGGLWAVQGGWSSAQSQ